MTLGTFALYDGVDRPHLRIIYWLSVLDAFGIGLIVGRVVAA